MAKLAASSLLFPLLVLAFCGDAFAQLTISEPIPTKSPIRQVSASSSEGILAARRLASSGSQIRVTVQYLMVDDVTRAEIYEIIGPSIIHHSVHATEISDSPSLQGISSRLGSSQQTRSPSWVTTCVLDDSKTAEIIQKAVQSESSDVSKAPNVSLLDGKEAEMSDIVQRPFVINIQQVGDATKPVMQVLDEGTRLRLLANLAEEPSPQGQTIHLTSEITISQILDVKTNQIFGLEDEPLTMHVPIHQITTATAAEQLLVGQTLLIDPHVSKSKSVRVESGVPMIAKIPYVGRRFRNMSIGSVAQNMMVLLQPSIEKRSR
jgi:hypothetical protein